MATINAIFKSITRFLMLLPSSFFLVICLILLSTSYLKSHPFKQDVLHFSQPFQVMLALDQSKSMGAKNKTHSRYQRAKHALKTFIRNNPDAYFGLMTYSNLVYPKHIISNNNQSLLKAVDQIPQSVSNNTSVIKHVFDYTNSHMRYHKKKRWLIIFTDGHFETETNLAKKIALYRITPIFVDISNAEQDLLLKDDTAKPTQKKISTLINKSLFLKNLATDLKGYYIKQTDSQEISRQLQKQMLQSKQNAHTLPTSIPFSFTHASALIFYLIWLLSLWKKKTTFIFSKKQSLIFFILLISMLPIEANTKVNLTLYQSEAPKQSFLVIDIPLENKDPLYNIPKGFLEPYITPNEIKHYLLMRHEKGTLKASQQVVFKIWNPNGPINIPKTKIKSISKDLVIPKKTMLLKHRPIYKPFFEEETQNIPFNFFIQRSDAETPKYQSEIKHIHYYFLHRSLKWKQFIFPLQNPYSLDNMYYCYDTSIINKANLRFYKSSFLCGQTKSTHNQSEIQSQAYLEQSTTSIYHYNFNPYLIETIHFKQNNDSTFPNLFFPLNLELRLNNEPKKVGEPFLIAVDATSQAPLKNLSTLLLSPFQNISIYHYKTENISPFQKTFFYIAKAKQKGSLMLPIFSTQFFNKDSQEFEIIRTKEVHLDILEGKIALKKTPNPYNNANFKISDLSIILFFISITLIIFSLFTMTKKMAQTKQRKP